MTHHYGAKKIL